LRRIRRSYDGSKGYSNALAEPPSICRKRLNSPSERGPQPSAMFAPTETATRPLASQPIDFVTSKFPRRVLQLQSKVLGFFPDIEFFKVLHALPPCPTSLLTPHDRFDFASSPGPAAKSYSQNSHPATATPRRRAPTRTELRKSRTRTTPAPGGPQSRRCAWFHPL